MAKKMTGRGDEELPAFHMWAKLCGDSFVIWTTICLRPPTLATTTLCDRLLNQYSTTSLVTSLFDHLSFRQPSKAKMCRQEWILWS